MFRTKVLKKNENTRFVLKNFFSKIVPLLR